MRSTPRGAHLLLQIRTKALNNEFEEVIRPATELLDGHNGAAERKAQAKTKTASTDRSAKAALEALAALDINQLSPVEALTKLYELQRRVLR